MPIGDEMKTFVLVLEFHPVAESAYNISQVQFAGGTHSRQHALFVWHLPKRCLSQLERRLKQGDRFAANADCLDVLIAQVHFDRYSSLPAHDVSLLTYGRAFPSGWRCEPLKVTIGSQWTVA